MSSKRRPARRSPFAHVQKQPVRRVRRWESPQLFRRQIIISFRKFRTNPRRRSKQFRQFIIELDGTSLREISIAIKRHGKTRRTKAAPSLPLARQFPLKTIAASLLIMLGIGSAIFFSTHLQKSVKFEVSPNQKVSAIAPVVTKTLPASMPVSLQVPKIGINTSLVQVGIQTNGQIEMPWDIGTAAWYKYSPTPGELGPSVIVGHLDGANYVNMAGIFYRLNELAPGDQIMVTRADGSVANFKVLYLKQVPRDNFPTKDIYGNINYAGIRLITCGGTFNNNTNLYTNNTVVFGALE